LKYGPEVDWWSLGIVVYMMMVGKVPLDESVNVLSYEVCHQSAQFPPYLTRNAVSILYGVSVITMKAETLGVLNSLLNAVFFHSWDTDGIAIK